MDAASTIDQENNLNKPNKPAIIQDTPKNPSQITQSKLIKPNRFGFSSGIRKPNPNILKNNTSSSTDIKSDERPETEINAESSKHAIRKTITSTIKSNPAMVKSRHTRTAVKRQPVNVRNVRGTVSKTEKVPVRSTSVSSRTRNQAIKSTNQDEENNKGEEVDEVSPETNEDVKTPETFEEIIKCFNAKYNPQINDILSARNKASKFNYRATALESAAVVRTAKVLFKEIQIEFKSIEETGISVEKTLGIKLESAENQVDQLSKSTSKLEKEIRELKIELKEIKTEAQSSNKAKDKLMNDQKEMVQLQQQELRARVEAENEKSDLRSQLAETKSKNDNLQLELERLKMVLSDKISELEAKDEQARQMKENIQEELKNELEMKEKDFLRQLDEMKIQSEQSKTQFEEMVKRVQCLDDKVAKDKEELSEQSLSFKTLQSEKYLVEKRIEMLENEVKDYKSKLDRKDNEVSNALESFKQVQDFARENTRRLESEKNELQKKLSTLDATYRELEMSNSSQISLKQQLEKQVEILTMERDNVQFEMEKNKELKKEMENQLQDKERDLSAQREVRLCLENQIRELRTEHIAVSAQMVAVRMESKSWKDRHQEEIQQEHEKLKTIKEDMDKERIAHKNEVQNFVEKIVSLESEIRTIRETANSERDEELEKICEVRREADLLRMKLNEQTACRIQSIEVKEQELLELQEKVRHGENLRRKMHNTIQELRGNVRVFARTRPFLPSDGDDMTSSIECLPDGQSLRLVSSHPDVEPYVFSFDKAFPPSAGQDQVFEEVSEFVQSALDGYQVCLFSYGQTGSGKTHTMQGSGHDQMRGIIPRSIKKVLEQSEAMIEHGWKYEMKVSFLEIYNENVRDLLSKEDGQKLQIKMSPEGKTYVHDLNLHSVETTNEIEILMEKASRKRSVGATNMNEESSRSHSVFTLHLNGTNESQRTILQGQLNLVDLAGSERLSRSGASGDRMKETQAINKSLSCLTDVFTAIGNKSSHVPFRNSKLTYLLQKCLSGDGKTLMMVNLSPTLLSFQESLCSLRFAQQVNRCELGKAKRQVLVNNSVGGENETSKSKTSNRRN